MDRKLSALKKWGPLRPADTFDPTSRSATSQKLHSARHHLKHASYNLRTLALAVLENPEITPSLFNATNSFKPSGLHIAMTELVELTHDMDAVLDGHLLLSIPNLPDAPNQSDQGFSVTAFFDSPPAYLSADMQTSQYLTNGPLLAKNRMKAIFELFSLTAFIEGVVRPYAQGSGL